MALAVAAVAAGAKGKVIWRSKRDLMMRLFTVQLAAAITLLCGAFTAAAGAEPAGKGRAEGQVQTVFERWLAAFNTGDTATIKAFYGKYLDDNNPVFALENARDTCGFELERIESSTPSSLTALLRQRCLPGLQRVKLEIDPDSAKLKKLSFRPLPLAGNGAETVTATIAGRLASSNDFAGSLIVSRGGKRLVARSWGQVETGRPARISLDTPMFLASAGKMFTAVGIMQLVDARKIDLDASLGTYLVDYPNAETAKVTIRQLLTHRGGTGDIGILGRDEGDNRKRVRTIADIVALNGNRPPDFPPGSKADYSNYGFILLGAVIERVTGTTYYDYVAEHVFAPAGMTRTGFPDRDHLQGVALGSTSFFGAEQKLSPSVNVLPWRGASAGGGVSTANDMLRFFNAMKSGKLLSPAMFKLATTAGATPWYGLGFVVDSGNGQSWGHGGNSYGMDVAAHHYAGKDMTFICLATRDMVCNRLIYAWYLRTFPPS